MATIWRVGDREGRRVRLTDDGWAHILERHADEMTGREADVLRTVEAPDLVNADVAHAHREVCYRSFGPGRPMLRVVVHYRPIPPQGTWSGEVITAHPTFRSKRGEPRRWP